MGIRRARQEKEFIISLFLTPMLMGVFGAGPALLQDTLRDDRPMRILVWDGTGRLFDSLDAAATRHYRLPSGGPKFAFRSVAPELRDTAVVLRAFDAALRAGNCEATVLLPPSVLEGGEAVFRSQNVSDVVTTGQIEERISRVVTAHRIAHAGLDPVRVAALTRPVSLRTVRVSAEGESESGFLQSFGLSYAFLIMMTILVMFSGQMMVRSLVEEKSNRIVEILVSSCTATDLMFGKVLGMSALALLQALVWVVLGGGVLLATGITGLPLENLPLMLLYFLLGFVLYAALFIAFGSLVSTEQDAQQITAYLSMLMMLPVVGAIIAGQNPDNPVLVVLSFIPVLTPQMMFVRLPITTPPAWEIALSLSILSLSILVVTWMAARLFRIGILLTGKRPTLGEIARWLRA